MLYKKKNTVKTKLKKLSQKRDLSFFLFNGLCEKLEPSSGWGSFLQLDEAISLRSCSKTFSMVYSPRKAVLERLLKWNTFVQFVWNLAQQKWWSNFWSSAIKICSIYLNMFFVFKKLFFHGAKGRFQFRRMFSPFTLPVASTLEPGGTKVNWMKL